MTDLRFVIGSLKEILVFIGPLYVQNISVTFCFVCLMYLCWTIEELRKAIINIITNTVFTQRFHCNLTPNGSLLSMLNCESPDTINWSQLFFKNWPSQESCYGLCSQNLVRKLLHYLRFLFT